MARLYGLGHMLLIGAQISHTVRQIKCDMTMHIQIKAAFRHTCTHTSTQTHIQTEWFVGNYSWGMFNMNS